MILIDDRLGSRELAQCKAFRRDRGGDRDRANPIPFELTRLDSGDVCFAGNGPTGGVLVGAELKSIPDVIQSCRDGRLTGDGGQLQRMREDYDIRYLIYYGEYRAQPSTGLLQMCGDDIHSGGSWYVYMMGTNDHGAQRTILWSHFERQVVSLSMCGVHIKHVPNKESAASFIVDVLYPWWMKDWSAHKSGQSIAGVRNLSNANLNSGSPALLAATMDDNTKQRAMFALSLRKVNMGYRRAIAAARHFTSPYHMATAEASEWEMVPGIGKTIAQRTVEAIRREDRGSKVP